MGSEKVKRVLASLILAIGSTANAYEAHEWGTFTSMVGSDGRTVEGMYHEDEKLPHFVHGFGVTQGDLVNAPTPAPLPPRRPNPPQPPCQNKGCFGVDVLQANNISQKMETPVIYFYSDKKQQVDVEVRFPQGVITETYPAPVETFPLQGATDLRNGKTKFSVTLDPLDLFSIPYVSPSNIYSHARRVASTPVRTGKESEKFIFYRGLGRFQPDFHLRAKDGLYIRAKRPALPRAAFLVHVDESGRTHSLDMQAETDQFLRKLPFERIQQLRAHSGDAGLMDADRTYNVMIAALIKEGLKTDEAVAMLNTWKHGYLKVPGLRLLYILPRYQVDRILPIEFTPAPAKLERVFVGRLEILTAEEEERLLAEVLNDSSFGVERLGRFAESILHRLKQVYENKKGPLFTDLEVLKRFDSLIEAAAKSDVIAGGSVH